MARFPKIEDKHDFAGLSAYLLKIKKNYPDKTDATVLMEPDIEYELLVHTMDAIRTAELEQSAEGLFEKIALFPDISIGDAP